MSNPIGQPLHYSFPGNDLVIADSSVRLCWSFSDTDLYGVRLELVAHFLCMNNQAVSHAKIFQSRRGVVLGECCVGDDFDFYKRLVHRLDGDRILRNLCHCPDDVLLVSMRERSACEYCDTDKHQQLSGHVFLLVVMSFVLHGLRILSSQKLLFFALFAAFFIRFGIEVLHLL